MMIIGCDLHTRYQQIGRVARAIAALYPKVGRRVARAIAII